MLNLHPWLIGHPHRIGYLEDVLADVRSAMELWIANAREIAAHDSASILTSDRKRSKLRDATLADDRGNRRADLEQLAVTPLRRVQRDAERRSRGIETDRNGQHRSARLAGAFGGGPHRRDQRIDARCACAASMPACAAERDIARAIGSVLRVVEPAVASRREQQRLTDTEWPPDAPRSSGSMPPSESIAARRVVRLAGTR